MYAVGASKCFSCCSVGVVPRLKGHILNYSAEQIGKALRDVSWGMPVVTA
jgi:hypothetical protein